MSLKDYEVPRDSFLLDKRGAIFSGFSFPCCCCEYNLNGVLKEPCRTCDHNATAVKDDPPNPKVLVPRAPRGNEQPVVEPSGK